MTMEDEELPTLTSVKPLKPEFSHLGKIFLSSEQFTLGRNVENSVVIPYLPISRLHCTFHKSENNEWFITDSSSFGIRVNNKRVQKGYQVNVSNGDVITLDPTAEFVYKFSFPNDAYVIPTKRIKREKSNDQCIVNDVKMMFEESQNFEIKHIEEKIQSAKQLQNTSINLKQQLQADMDRKTEQLKSDFAEQIQNLKGEKDEVEKQKLLLIQERDEQLAQVKNEMEGKIAELMEQIQRQNEAESELLKENNLLKEKLDKEREEFLSELNRENSSKQDLLDKLETKIREQEEIRQKEKQELEDALRKETEQLRLAQEKELKELAEQKRLREQEHELELTNIKQKLQEKVEQTEQQKREIEEQLNQKMEQLEKISAEEKIRVEQLQKEREEIQNQLLEAQKNKEASLAELKNRETELASIAAARIQQQADQSSEVISMLQEQLEKKAKDLESMETEKNTLLSIYMEGAGEGTSKQSALNEVGELMENELQCSICAELFIEAITLNCSHTFCKYCITTWKKKKRDCPICRAAIKAENRSLVLDSFIDKMVQNLTEEMKVKRQDILQFRADQVSVSTSRRSTTSSRTRRTPRTSSRGRGSTSSSAVTVAIGTTTQIQTMDLTRLRSPMSQMERPPPPPPMRVVRLNRAPPPPQTQVRVLRPMAPPGFHYPEVVDLTRLPAPVVTRPERPPAPVINEVVDLLEPPATVVQLQEQRPTPQINEVVDLTMMSPIQLAQPPPSQTTPVNLERRQAVTLVAVDARTSLAFPGHTMAGTGVVSHAVHAATGRPAVHFGSATATNQPSGHNLPPVQPRPRI